MTTPAAIQEAVRRIAEGFHPRAIILFGSQARGTADRHSDVDLIVVMDQVDNHIRMATEMSQSLWGLRLPCDIVVFSAEEFDRERDLPGFVRVACREGRVMYGHAA